jgi:hypothetical protein
MNDCGAKSKLSGPLIISQKPGTTVRYFKTQSFIQVWFGLDLILNFLVQMSSNLVGEIKFLELTKTGRRLMVVSPGIVGHLLRFKPDVIFAQAYSLWTLLALLLKPWGKWALVPFNSKRTRMREDLCQRKPLLDNT